MKPGTIIYYRLAPKDIPCNPLKLWKGKILAGMNDYLFIESLEPGYESLTETIHVSQIVEKQKE